MAEATVFIEGGLVIDAGGERRADVLVRAGRVVEVGPTVAAPAGATRLDASGCVVAPGLVDLHAHLREPGMEQAECIETGARAAALGGYTAVVAMPNTTPPVDDAAVARQVLDAGRDACCEVHTAAAITVGRAGERLAPMAELAALGVRIFTDDGVGVQDGGVMRRALEYASGLRPTVTLAQHCEDAAIAAGGHMHEGAWSSRLGVAGQPAAAEEAMVARDIALVRLTGARLHFLHLSSAASVELVRRAKAEGLPVTAEVTPHHLCLTDAELAGYDARFKVNPPLRTAADVAALRAGAADGAIDAVATDHAPHPPEAKDQPLDLAPPGMLGLQTAFAAAYGALARGTPPVDESVGPRLSLGAVLALLSWRPAAIAGLAGDAVVGPDGRRRGGHGGPIVPGAPANLCVVDPDAEVIVDAAALASRSRNTPFDGRRLTGRVRHTVLHGEPVVVDGQAQR